MSTIQRLRHSVGYARRQKFERRMRVKFSRTIRRHMRDPALCSAEKVWTEEDANLADALLKVLAKNPHLTDAEFLEQCADDEEDAPLAADVHRV